MNALLERVKTLRAEIESASGGGQIPYSLFYEWGARVVSLVEEYYGPDSIQLRNVNEANTNFACGGRGSFSAQWGLVKAALAALEHDVIAKPPKSSTRASAIDQLRELFSRFHAVVRQLRTRSADQSGIDIVNEADVQYLTHALLHTLFDDIRAEDYTPSHSGRCSRIDFVLKKERIAVETKKTRPKLADKELGEELAIDIARYTSHPDCDALFCFIYDPENRVLNPHGLACDLEKLSSPQLNIVVVINPLP